MPHEYIRGGVAKLLTLLHPASGVVRAKGVLSSANVVLHPWLQDELRAVVQTLPPLPDVPGALRRAQWEYWQQGLTQKLPLPVDLPPLRVLLVWDNLAGHKTPALVSWLFAHGIMPLYTPLGGSWLNMAESLQRIVVGRALSGSHPRSGLEIIAWLEAVVCAWNRSPTPFVWGGKRATRRQRARERRRAFGELRPVGGSGACTWQALRMAA